MTTVLERADATAAWGIEPVPRDRRVLSGWDMAVLWGDLGIGLLVLVAGALLVPGLGFAGAFAAIVVGSIIGVGLLALAAAAGADHGVPTMVLFRPVLGLRGSWLPSLLNAAQLVGWTAVELWAMSFVADLVSRRVFGFSSRWLWLAVAAGVCTALALWGPIGVTRIWMKRFGAWMITGILVVVTILLVSSDATRAALARPGTGALPFGAALDLVIAMPISWLPLVADYSRFVARPRAAFLGTFGGYLVANVWLYALGAMLLLSGGAEPSPEGIAAGILSVAGGSVAGVLFLVGLLVGETDEAFADIYSGAVSIRNIVPVAPQRVLVVAIVALSTVLAAWLTMTRYEAFLFLIGSLFVPLFGILAADHFIVRAGQIRIPDLYSETGRYWYRRGFRLATFIPWVVGFAIYHWIVPVGPQAWLDLWSGWLGEPLILRYPWLAASLPSFVVAFVLAVAVSRLSSRQSRRER